MKKNQEFLVVELITRSYEIEAATREEAIEGCKKGLGRINSPASITRNAFLRKKNPHLITKQPWPVILLPLKGLAKRDDRGAGDIIARVIGPIGGEAFKKWYKTIFGKDCGCGARQEALNARWPL